MHKLLACLYAGFFLSMVPLRAQITLDASPSATENREISPIKLAHSGSKYLDLSEIDRQKIKVLDEDGKLFRLLSLPADPPNTISKQITALTENLFDQDPNNIEFVIIYKRRFISKDGSQNLVHDYYIISETAEVLFHKPETVFLPSGPSGDLIWREGENYKICVMDINPASADYQKVHFYSLPGTLPQAVNTEGSRTARLHIDWTHLRDAPQSVAEIQLFRLDGRLVHVIQVGPAELNLKNHRSQYPKGSYFYQLLSREGKILQPKRMVKI